MGAPQYGCPQYGGTGGGWGAQPHRIMGRPLQLDFDLGARGVRGTVTWGKRGGHEHQWGGVPGPAVA